MVKEQPFQNFEQENDILPTLDDGNMQKVVFDDRTMVNLLF